MGLNLEGRISLDGAGFERGLQRAGDRVTDFVKNAAVAAFGFYGVEEAIRKTVETATDLVNESKRLDLTVEQLQVMRQAAKDAGTDMEAVATALERINNAREKALKGDKDASLAFRSLGVTGPQLQNATAATLLTTTLAQTVRTKSVEDIGPALKEVMGRGFGQLIPFLKTDFEELGGEMKNLGTIMDADTAVKLKHLGDEFDLLKTVLGAQLGPVLITLVETILDLIGKIKGAGAFWGTVFEHLETLTPDTAKPGVLEPGTFGDKSKLKINVWKAIWEEIFGGGAAKPEVGNIPAAKAQEEPEKDWQDRLEKLRKKLEEEAKAIENPPVRTGDTGVATKVSRVPDIKAPDALVKVGNFLGSNGNVISRVEQQKLDHLKGIHDNTGKLLARQGNSAWGATAIGVPIT